MRWPASGRPSLLDINFCWWRTMYICWKSQQSDLGQPGRGFFRCGWSQALSPLILVAVLIFGCATIASSQGTSEAQIVAPTLLTIKSATETRVPIRVITDHQNAFVLIEGLPKAVALSAGRLFDSGVWAVKVSELDQLKIVAMVNSTEEHDLSLSLKTLDGSVLAEFKTALRISPLTEEEVATENVTGGEVQTAAVAPPVEPEPEIIAPPPATPEVSAAKADRAPIAPAPPVISEADMETILLLMRKGSENMQQGKINVARLFYTRAADKGWADAAFSLARTYDEVELEKIGAIGVQPDPVEAARWYKRAVELGSTTAVAYLERFR